MIKFYTPKTQSILCTNYVRYFISMEFWGFESLETTDNQNPK